LTVEGIIPLVDGAPARRAYVLRVLEATVVRVFAAARSVAADDDAAAEVTRRVLAADPCGRPDILAVRGVRLASLTAPHPAYAAMDEQARETVALARALQLKADAIAETLAVSRADVLRRLSRGLRQMRPLQPGCADAASPARAGRAS